MKVVPVRVRSKGSARSSRLAWVRLSGVLLAVAVALALHPIDSQAAVASSATTSSASQDRMCASLYRNQKRTTENIRFGKKTTWNWTASAALVCSEDFG